MTASNFPANPFSKDAEFWLDDGVPVAVDGDGVFGFGPKGKFKLGGPERAPWPEAADTRGPLTWDEFLAACRFALARGPNVCSAISPNRSRPGEGEERKKSPEMS